MIFEKWIIALQAVEQNILSALAALNVLLHFMFWQINVFCETTFLLLTLALCLFNRS